MTIYLLRHAIAEEHSHTGADRDRALTDEGIVRLRQVVQVGHEAGMKPQLVLSSPYLRAKQTAEVARFMTGCDEEVVYSDALTPAASPADAWQEIRLYRESDPILVASHDPLISSLLSFLMGTNQYIHSFKKSGLAKVELHHTGTRPGGELQWLLTPALARAALGQGTSS
jgi:phosphohistidine phosphatase